MLHQVYGQALTDEDGRFLQVNQVLCDMLGFTVADLLQRGVRDITHPEDWPDNITLLHRLRLEEQSFSLVKRAVRADGAVVWVQVYASMMWDQRGRPAVSALVRPVLPEPARAQPAIARAPVEPRRRPRPLPRRGPPIGSILH